jgi:serine/threonine protein kinase
MKEKSQDWDEYLDDEGEQPMKADLHDPLKVSLVHRSGQLLWDQDDTDTYSDLLQRGTEGRMEAVEREELARFLKRCFVLDPALRPTASELLQDPYFQ